jgi:transposase-like protein
MIKMPDEGYERTKVKADSLKEEHERKILREKQRHDNIMEELKLMAKHKIVIFDRRER